MTRLWVLGIVLSALSSLCSCGAAGGQAANAVLNTSIAASVAAVRRSRGDCYTPCAHGTECNPDTGLCDPVPCEGRCAYGESCVGSGDEARCVVGGAEADGTPLSEVVRDETRPAAVERWEEEDRNFQTR